MSGKFCPLDNKGIYLPPENEFTGRIGAQGSQFCKVTTTGAFYPIWGGYFSPSLSQLTVTNCCVRPIMSEASCVAPNTMVLMADGTNKMIQKVVPGDMVKGHTSNNKVLDIVILTLDNRDMYSLNDGLLKLTSEHPILTKDGWKSINGDAKTAMSKYNIDHVGKLEIGDQIITADGMVELKTKEKLPLEENTTTFNLKLDGDETFYAGSILVKDN
jgi:hypothetical protein